MSSIINKIIKWPQGIRFYIAITTLFVTAESCWWTNSVYGNSSTAIIRLQEIYAWISLGLILLTLTIGPLCNLVPRLPGQAVIRDARRLLGVSAAWFAGWHVSLSYVNQFHGANPLHLPAVYQRAFGLGLVALVILIALAVTSFDAAFRRLGRWWFRLHRLIYAAVLLVLLHAFMIGVHATSWLFIVTISAVVAALFAAQLYLGFGPGREPTILRSIVLCYGLLLTVGVFAYGFSQHLDLSPAEPSSKVGQYGVR